MNSCKRVVILNGPPGCGKDTIGAALLDQMECITSSFKYDLYEATAAYYNVDLKRFIALATDRNTKEQYCKNLNRSPREAMIFVSEEVFKPRYGRDYFGLKAYNRVMDYYSPKTVIFTDGGFEEEIMVFPERGIPTVIIQLHGRGDFENDSRDYVCLLHPLCQTYQLHLVEGEIDQAVGAIQALLKAV
jgi:hypothetical protein